MSEKEKRVPIELPKRERELLEQLSREAGLTVEQGIELALLYFFKEHDPEIFEEVKEHVRTHDPEVLRVFEKG